MSHVESKECSKSTASTTSEKDNELLLLSSESPETTTTTTTTIITNPGIAERLEQDIVGFESYGFSFHRRHGEDGTIGILIRSSSSITTSCCCCLQIQVSNISLMASIGPFLRTLVRLCIHPINPRCLHARIVLLECNNNKTSPRSIAHAIHMIIRNSMGAALFMDLHIVLPRRKAAISTVHQQVLEVMKQNDDGCYEYPSVILHNAPTNEEKEEDCFFVGGCNHDRMMRKPFLIDLGIFVPNENDDTTNNNNKKGTTTNTSSSSSQPPCIRNPLTFTCLDEYDPQQHYLDLNVSTRMCTVRLTPLLFHLSQRLLSPFFHQSEPSSSSLNTTTTTATFSSLQQQEQQASNQDDNFKTKIILMVCLEKISNLYRVLMLVRDYYYYYDDDDDDDDDNGSGGDKEEEQQQQQLQLVVVCKSSNIQQRFQSEANTFCFKNHILGGNNLTIRILTIQTAKEFLIQQQQQQYDSQVRVIGFDLHDNARTLLSNHHHYGNDGTEMKNLLLGISKAEAEAAANGGNPTITTTSIIILGFESDGIPKTIDEVITEYVQIESRTSINVVAAFSIVLHIVMTTTTTTTT